MNTNWMLATAGPRTSMCVSRHGDSARIAAEIFDADVMPADESAFAVHRHDLAVIAEVDLEAIDESRLVANGCISTPPARSAAT